MSQAPAAPAAPVTPADENQPPAREGGTLLRILPILLVAIPGVLFAVVVAGRYVQQKDAAPLLPVLGELPAFELVERNGNPVTLDNLKGRIWIADFIFTRCAGPCPIMTGHLATLQHTIKRKTLDIRLVSFTLDPENDTPETLDNYAKLHKAEPGRWLFVRGDKAAIQRLATEGFKLGAIEQVQGEIIHSTRFVLVDAFGRIRGYYDGQEADSIQKLRRDLDLLIKESTR